MKVRYQQLGLAQALSSRSNFAQACNELALILEKAYQYAPKALQTIVFQDVLFAIRRLQELETSQELAAVTKVVHAAEVVLPRQRRVQVVSEFKHAAIVQRRRKKVLKTEEAHFEFGFDILGQVFRLLDARSLARAAAVCRSWRIAANDELLWEELFKFNFWGIYTYKLSGSLEGRRASTIVGDASNEDLWKKKFKDAIIRHPLQWFSSNRAFCKRCDMCMWLPGKGPPVCAVSGSQTHLLKPLLPVQVVQLLLEDCVASSSSSSSDSDDSDDMHRTGGISKLWALPKLSN